jgi:predicted nucleic acid-binding protein
MFASSALPTSAEAPSVVLVDTSVAVSLVLADHEAHEDTMRAVRRLRLGLAGHAWFETYSVLTRLPPRSRRSPAVVRSILESDFPETRFLDGSVLAELRAEISSLGIAGGAVYDALIGATARAFSLPLLSRDKRARATYDALGVDVRILG